jgi:hypothetical protein
MPWATAVVAIDNGTVLVLIALIAIPFAAISFSRAGEAYRSIGKGDLVIDEDLTVPRYLRRADPAVDPAIQAAEVRQMLEAKADRLQRHGESPFDVDAEAARLLAPAGGGSDLDAKLREEVRSLVLARNERRMRNGQAPLDVEAETERQLADFIGLGE